MRISDWSSDVCSSDLLLQSGEVDVIHTATASQIDSLRSLGDDIDLIESDAYGEVGYFLLNTAPDTVFSSLTARQAAAHARSEERREGKECVSTGRSRWSP